MLLDSKKVERTAIFDLMTGSKKDLRESFKEYRILPISPVAMCAGQVLLLSWRIPSVPSIH